MSGSLAAVAPGAGVRGAPNPNIRAVNDAANPNMQQGAAVPDQSQPSIPPQILAALLAQQGQGQAQPQPQQPAVSPRIPLQPNAPSVTGSVPALPTASPPQTPQPSPDAMRLFSSSASGNPDVDSLAKQGRNGDTHMVHAQTGELNIPTRVQTPALMDALHKVFHSHGLNMHQFIVGHPDGSVNPSTGAQEFAGVSINQNQSVPTVGGMGGSLVQPSSGSNTTLAQLLQSAAVGNRMMSGGNSGAMASGGGTQSLGSTVSQGIQQGQSLGKSISSLGSLFSSNGGGDAIAGNYDVAPVQQESL